MKIPTNAWAGRQLIGGSGWRTEWHGIPGGSIELIDWASAPATPFPPFPGARSPVMVACVDGFGWYGFGRMTAP